MYTGGLTSFPFTNSLNLRSGDFRKLSNYKFLFNFLDRVRRVFDCLVTRLTVSLYISVKSRWEGKFDKCLPGQILSSVGLRREVPEIRRQVNYLSSPLSSIIDKD